MAPTISERAKEAAIKIRHNQKTKFYEISRTNPDSLNLHIQFFDNECTKQHYVKLQRTKPGCDFGKHRNREFSTVENTVNRGLDNGLTINEIKEAMVQLYAYCGFPRSLNAINTLKSVVEERKSKGKKDVEGKAGSVENKVADK